VWFDSCVSIGLWGESGLTQHNSVSYLFCYKESIELWGESKSHRCVMVVSTYLVYKESIGLWGRI
jgi:hypothetical protein